MSWKKVRIIIKTAFCVMYLEKYYIRGMGIAF